jgi:hypothetical protein
LLLLLLLLLWEEICSIARRLPLRSFVWLSYGRTNRPPTVICVRSIGSSACRPASPPARLAARLPGRLRCPRLRRWPHSMQQPSFLPSFLPSRQQAAVIIYEPNSLTALRSELNMSLPLSSDRATVCVSRRLFLPARALVILGWRGGAYIGKRALFSLPAR